MGARPRRSDWFAFCDRHFAALSTAVLALAAFNLTFRLGAELITEWEEAVYAQTAWEMLKSGNWVATTFYGVVDYYNVKPPLQSWLLAVSFKTFGISLLSLRLVSVACAWLTVLALMLWTRRAVGAAVALGAGIVLSTTFAFLHVHSARSGNADALLTLLILLVVVTLWAARNRPGRLMWLGPLLAAVFLLKGLAVLLPLAIVGTVLCFSGRHDLRRWLALAAALAAASVPVMAWAVARWRFDEWKFLGRVLSFDFVARSVQPLDEHGGTPLYYVNILQKHHYEWLLAGAVAWLMLPRPRAILRRLVEACRSTDTTAAIVLVWAIVTLIIPTLMATKLPWYLNPFYPVFALGTSWLIVRGLSLPRPEPNASRRVMLGALIGLTLLVAEGKFIWYSYQYRDLATSSQGLLVASRDDIAGREVFQQAWTRADRFMVEAIIGAHTRTTASAWDFVNDGCPGNILLSPEPIDSPGLELVRSDDRHWLYRRR
jgi:4-amino-4-deoxy-L-arabinose transferase-like glycosyltransferase